MSGLNDTPSGERVHIGFFGVRNAGKSSLVNKITGQDLSVVSEIKGTTTDPVKKAMELLPLGPVLIIDTPGFDDVDTGELGELRIKKTREILAGCDIAVLVIDWTDGINEFNGELVKLFEEREIPFVIAYNKCDLRSGKLKPHELGENELYVSALTGENVDLLKEKLARLNFKSFNKSQERRVIADLLRPDDAVILVIPIDASAPKGRLILPQQQTIRDILDAHNIAVTCQDTELERVLRLLSPAARHERLNAENDGRIIVITDSQVFKNVEEIIDLSGYNNVYLTSFSILFARYKGDLELLIQGAAALADLRTGDKVLISEGCTHHRQCGDIGTVKLPAWIRKFCNQPRGGERLDAIEPDFTFTSGGEFPDVAELRDYKLIIHCGGCMLNEREMRNRLDKAREAKVPVVNYGIAIAHMHGILARSLELFNLKCGL